MATYYNPTTKETVTSAALEMQGVKTPSQIKDNGFVLIDYVYPAFDELKERIEPAAKLTLDKETGHYVQKFTVKPLDEETLAQNLEMLKAECAAKVDKATSDAILGGFETTVKTDKGEEELHFSYDQFDQGNFTDTAVAASAGNAALPTSIQWNGYRVTEGEGKGELVLLTLSAAEFLPIYAAALNHKAEKMTIGGGRKAYLEAATSIDEVRTLMGEWGL